MTLVRVVVLGLLLTGLSSCWTPPFRETPHVPMANESPRDVVGSFGRRLPASIQVVNTATFEFAWRSLAVLGLTRVDRTTGTYRIVGLHPAGGVKLFEVAGDRSGVTESFAQPQLEEQGDIVSAIGEDATRIYLDWLPSDDAESIQEPDRIRFVEPEQNTGHVEYVFAGKDGVLVEKSGWLEGARVWTVRYYEYEEHHGSLHPMGIVLEHHDHDYRLVLRLKEVLS